MKLYKQNKIIKIINLNNNCKYKRRYCLGPFKFTIKNKRKIKFYIDAHLRHQNQERREKYLSIINEMKSLSKYHNANDYIITCCIVTYNHEKTISECIESLLNQKTKYKYIIKIYDDCSTDNTVEICREYAKKYPEKIEYILQPENTHSKQASAFFENIKTKYYTIIDGDDYWCNENKLEMGIDFLENHPDYVIWAHDTLFNNALTGNSYSYVHAHLGFNKITNPIGYDNFVYLHLSARIHRNIIDWKKEYKFNRKRDIFIYHATLDRGLMYYHDEIMSVYNFNKMGIFSKLNREESIYSNYYSYYMINKYLSYRHDDYFSKAIGQNIEKYKKVFGKKLGWKIKILLIKYETLFKLIKQKFKIINNIEKGHKLYSNSEYNKLKEIANSQL